jgi:hypothetical protein
VDHVILGARGAQWTGILTIAGTLGVLLHLAAQL